MLNKIIFGFTFGIIAILINAQKLHTLIDDPSLTTIVLGLSNITIFDNNYNQSKTYNRYSISGYGPFWKEDFGIGYLFINTTTELLFHQDYEAHTYEIQYYNNLTDSPEIIHAHGQQPSYKFDGVPYLQAAPIPPQSATIYTYSVKQLVTTNFIHSHYGFHHQNGMSTPLILWSPLPLNYPKADLYNTAKDVIMFIEDGCPWPTEEGYDVNPSCFDIESTYEVLNQGWNEMESTFDYDMCMNPIQDSDVSYSFLLVNHRPISDPVIVLLQPGELIRLRIINSGGMLNYKLDFGDLVPFMTIIATDGNLCNPFTISSEPIWITVGQRLDITIIVPEKIDTFPIFALAEANGESLTLQGALILTTQQEQHYYYSMYPLFVKSPGMSGSFPNFLLETYLTAFEPLITRPIDQIFQINITGDGGFNGINRRGYQLPPIINEFQNNPFPLVVAKGQRVCFDIMNFNTDPHAMHLHGHSFQIVKYGNTTINGPIRDTVLIPSGLCQQVRICTDTNNPGKHPLHCHMSFHEMAGMFTTLEYDEYDDPFNDTVSSPNFIIFINLVTLLIIVTIGIILCIFTRIFTKRRHETNIRYLELSQSSFNIVQ